MLAVSTDEVSTVIRAVAPLAWPVLLAVVIWRYGGSWAAAITSAIRERDVKAKVGIAEVSIGGKSVPINAAFANATKVIDDLQKRISSAGTAAPGTAGLDADEAEDAPAPSVRRLLWVDDEQDGIALEVSAVKERGIAVLPRTSSDEAIEALLADDRLPDAVVSDMGRWEGGAYKATAGLELLDRVHEIDPLLPVIFYTSPEKARSQKAAALGRGAFGITASPSALLELLLINIGPHSAQRMEVEAIAIMGLAGYREVTGLAERGVDFLMEKGDERIGVEIRATAASPPADRLGQSLVRAGGEALRLRAAELLFVVAVPCAVPDADLPRIKISIVTLEDMRRRFAPAK